MRIGLLIYGSLDTLSGGYLYDRMLVDYLRAQGDELHIISLPWRSYAAHLGDNLTFRLPPGLDMLIQDELNHPSLRAATHHKPYPVVSLVHHLRCSELRPGWQNAFYRMVERRYLNSVDGFIFNSHTTHSVVASLVRDRKASIVAYPPTDRFGPPLPEAFVRSRAAQSGPLRLLFLGNVIPRKGLHTVLKALLPRHLHRTAFGAHRPGAPSGVQVKTRSDMKGKENLLFNLDVVGSLTADPVYARKMQELATVRGLRSTVRFYGPLEDAALVEKLKQAQVLVVPSSYEGFGIVYLEGMAFGLPAICTSAW